jgi:myo-inositol 2-dehydrogenase/D-chiro-inositol 1-dehydrogenase
MTHKPTNRRQFLKTSAGLTGALAATPYFYTNHDLFAAQNQAKNDRLSVAAIGNGGRGSAVGHQAGRLGDMVACCDVDKNRAAGFAKKYGEKCKTYGDYRQVLDRKDIDLVTIGTPDHWHVKIAIEAMQSGKDVYCEKPLTLTIDEGKKICRVVKETGRVFQVGTQQRSEYGNKFIKAVAIARSGRLGKKLRAISSVGGARSGGPFKSSDPPANFDWNMWLGQAPMTPYIKERTHYQFRWWLEYSGGQVTDWGVHHTDIAMWALGLGDTGPTTIEGTGKFNRQPDCYNVAQTFDCTMDFANGHQIVLNSGRNELILEGEKGRIRVNRGSLTGKIVEDIAKDKSEQQKLDEEVRKLYRGRPLQGHMQDLFSCIKDRALPISDVFTHHRSVSVCHLANIAMLCGRKLTWDPQKEDFVGDEQASSMVSRKQRKGFEINA